MSPITFQDDSSSAPQPACPSLCPVCTGPLCVTRGQSRCLRCQFTFCQDCDGEQPDADCHD